MYRVTGRKLAAAWQHLQRPASTCGLEWATLNQSHMKPETSSLGATCWLPNGSIVASRQAEIVHFHVVSFHLAALFYHKENQEMDKRNEPVTKPQTTLISPAVFGHTSEQWLCPTVLLRRQRFTSALVALKVGLHDQFRSPPSLLFQA